MNGHFSTSADEKSQGRKANDSGSKLERHVKDLLTRYKVDFKPQHEIPVYTELVETAKVDFYVYPNQLLQFSDGLIIECKRQDTEGSADVKIVWTHELIKHHLPHPAIVVVDGKRARKAEKYLQKRIGGNLRAVIRYAELESWIRERVRVVGDNGYLPFS